MPPPNEMTEVYLVKGAISMLNAKKLVQEIWSTVGRLEKWPARSRKSSSQTNKKLSRKVENRNGKIASTQMCQRTLQFRARSG